VFFFFFAVSVARVLLNKMSIKLTSEVPKTMWNRKRTTKKKVLLHHKYLEIKKDLRHNTGPRFLQGFQQNKLHGSLVMTFQKENIKYIKLSFIKRLSERTEEKKR